MVTDRRPGILSLSCSLLVHTPYDLTADFQDTNLPDFSLTMSACELPSMTVMDLPPPSRPLKLKLKVASPDSVAIELHVRTCSLRHSLADCGFPVGGGYLDADDNLVEKGPGANYVRWTEALPFQHVSKIADIIENNANTGLINPLQKVGGYLLTGFLDRPLIISNSEP